MSAALARPDLQGRTPGSNPYLFVVGAACSGTTVLQRMPDWSSSERTPGQFGTWQLDRAVSSALYWRYGVAMCRESGIALGAESDIAAIEVAVGELLGEFGYAPGGSPATPALRVHVGDVRSAYTANLRVGGRPLPGSWAA